MSETEDRLTAMENALAEMQKNIDDITSTETNTLRNSIDALTTQLSLVTTALQVTDSKLHQGGYEPWGEEQEVLLTHKYVAREVLANVLWRALRAVENFHTGWRAVHNLLEAIPSHRISRTTRFPPHGSYININNLDVFHLMQQLKEHAYRASAEAHQGGSTTKFKEVLSQLQTLAVATVGSGRTVGMIHHRNSFEEEYKLQWVIGMDAVSEDNVAITGVSTPV